MQVQREFQSPEVVHWLETIDEGMLHDLMDGFVATGDDQPLTAWQREGILEAMQDVAEGRVVEHERVLEWVESWGSDHELPMPT